MRRSEVVKIENACYPMKIAVRTPQRTRHVMVLAAPHTQELSARVKKIMNSANIPARSVVPKTLISETFFKVETPSLGCIEGREKT